MYPNLYYLFKDLFHLDLPALKMIQSFGFFVAISFLLCAWCFAKELQRKEQMGLLRTSIRQVVKGGKATPLDLVTSGIIGFIIFYKLIFIVMNFSAFTEDTQGYLLSTKGNFIAGLIGAAGAAYLKYREKEQERKKLNLDQPKTIDVTMHPHEHVGNMTIIAAVAGLLGAKLFDIFENFHNFSLDPWGTIFSFSGLTMYGGLIVGAAAVIYYAKKNGLTVTHVIDACAPGLFLAYGVGRIGCHVAGDGDWGIPSTSPAPSFIPQWAWSYTYPHNVINEGDLMGNCEGKYCSELPIGVYPTPFYEAVMAILLFFVLWSVRKRFTTPGVLFSVYLLLNGVERFFIEKIRVNHKYHIGSLEITQAEIISSLLIILGITGIWYFRKKAKEPPPPPPDEVTGTTV